MIRVLAGRDRLLAWLGADSQVWRGKASKATDLNRDKGRHVSGESLWSALRPGLTRLQHNKCAYCESELEADGVEWTVDHHRPKGRVHSGTNPAEDIHDVGGASQTGYYLLAYEPDNFIGSCGTCNKYKDNYFPTAGARALHTGDRAALRAERPYLVDPTDEQDTDPERLIDWRGTFAVAAPDLDEHGVRRAAETIRLLGLNRDKLQTDRALVLMAFWYAWEKDKTADMDALCAPGVRYSACTRRFRLLCGTDPAAAEEVFDQATDLVLGRDRTAV
ncbi:hypothetical protein [Actinokineospora cianjurensis]|uniref:HNH endonuclease n=1 Tax=Actinokineospora cianjurensis TaxID=585224 RepID=A0A421B0Q3_9PSEU|nr:hypothetical protein [Actinokineospora cianjurensis]RLK57964.1 hypothetical protein CLV68_4055 [Actinokineospora cianjurensis]